MRTLVSISTLALAATLSATPAFAEESRSGAAPAAAPAPAGASATGASASGGDDKKLGVGGDVLFTLPVGDMADATGPLIGLALRGGYYVMPEFEAYARVGYQMGFKKEQSAGPLGSLKTGISNIPIYVGGRYFFMQPGAGAYGQAEIGANMLKQEVELAGTSKSDTQTRFGFNLGAGYVISKELPINLGAQFNYFNLIGTESGELAAYGITVQAGYEARF